MSVLIIDYGMGNIASARRSLEECGATVLVSSDPSALDTADRAVVPGVGAFSVAMRRLAAAGWVEALRASAIGKSMPLLGICLGMQLLADRGEEGGATAGLGLIPGQIKRMTPSRGERIPHVGWNEITANKADPLLSGIPDRSDFYFVHSYQFMTDIAGDVLATTDYCGGITAAVSRRNVFGVQFHPEKSSRVGRRLLQNFLEIRC